jgi:hypothetical protein
MKTEFQATEVSRINQLKKLSHKLESACMYVCGVNVAMFLNE